MEFSEGTIALLSSSFYFAVQVTVSAEITAVETIAAALLLSYYFCVDVEIMDSLADVDADLTGNKKGSVQHFPFYCPAWAFV